MHDRSGAVVGWATDTRPEALEETWEALAARFPQTGLWPVALESGPLSLDRDDGWAADAARDPLATLTDLWEDLAEDDEDLPPEFPGLGQGDVWCDGATTLALGEVDDVAALLLVAATRPADVPGALGWTGAINHVGDTGPVCAVLRAWEERYHAVLVGLGDDSLTLAVSRPPAGAQARLAAAERYALCPDSDEQDLGALAAQINGARVWALWWD